MAARFTLTVLCPEGAGFIRTRSNVSLTARKSFGDWEPRTTWAGLFGTVAATSIWQTSWGWPRLVPAISMPSAVLVTEEITGVYWAQV